MDFRLGVISPGFCAVAKLGVNWFGLVIVKIKKLIFLTGYLSNLRFTHVPLMGTCLFFPVRQQ